MRKRVVLGSLLFFGAAIQAGLAWHVLGISNDNNRLVEVAWEKADTLCREAVSSVGSLSESGEEIVVNSVLAPEEDWRVVLMNASSVISHCSTRSMTYFCMGRSCGEVADRTTLSNLEEQNLSPYPSDILKTEPVKVLFRLKEIKS